MGQRATSGVRLMGLVRRLDDLDEVMRRRVSPAMGLTAARVAFVGSLLGVVLGAVLAATSSSALMRVLGAVMAVLNAFASITWWRQRTARKHDP